MCLVVGCQYLNRYVIAFLYRCHGCRLCFIVIVVMVTGAPEQAAQRGRADDDAVRAATPQAVLVSNAHRSGGRLRVRPGRLGEREAEPSIRRAVTQRPAYPDASCQKSGQGMTIFLFLISSLNIKSDLENKRSCSFM